MRPDDWFLKIDITKFYDSVAHDTLRATLARRFRERRLLDLFDRLLDSYSAAPGRGLPIGALTSQYLGNFYLDCFDHWRQQTGRQPRTLRYMDDILTFGPRDELRLLRDRAVPLLDRLGLRIKEGGVLNHCALGVPFLGFTLYPARVRLNRGGRKRLRRRTRELERTHISGAISAGELQARGEALFAHARWGDDAAWRRTVLGFSRLNFGEAPAPATRDPRRHVGQTRPRIAARLIATGTSPMIAIGTSASVSAWPPARWQHAAGRRAFPRSAQPGRNHGVPAPRRNPIRVRSGEGAERGSFASP